MPPVFPYVPETITVHLGPPDESAQNVTVSFPDYIKNVVSSEIFPYLGAIRTAGQHAGHYFLCTQPRIHRVLPQSRL